MYAAFAASAFQTRLAYRGQVWAAVFGQLVEVFAKVAIWMSIYAGIGGATGGVTLPEMITYAILGGAVISAWPWTVLVRRISDQIKTGDVAVFLLKPLRYPAMQLANEIGVVAFQVLAVIVPVVAITGLTYGLVPPASFFHGLAYPAFLLLGFGILFLLALIAGLLAFWLLTAFSMEWLLQALLSLLSGVLVPLWFFPPAVAAMIVHLPFAYVAFHPMAVYLGKLDPAATGATFAIGVGWALALAAFAAWLWHRAARRIVVQGG
jgi:ABC-2 type transport system permease protein